MVAGPGKAGGGGEDEKSRIAMALERDAVLWSERRGRRGRDRGVAL